jgi:hypothetical protein
LQQPIEAARALPELERRWQVWYGG